MAMEIQARFPKRGKLLEFSLAVVVIGICGHFLLAALWRAQGEAERVMVESTVRNVNSAVRMAQAQLIVQGREGEVPGLFAGSPARWLEAPPAEYVEVEREADVKHSPGRWVWVRQAGVLYYTPRHREVLVAAENGALAWRWNSGRSISFQSGLKRYLP